MGSYKNTLCNRHIYRKKQKKYITEQLTKSKIGSYNYLTKKERGILEQLKIHDIIIITSPDKVGAIVIQDVKQKIYFITRRQ